MYSLRTGGCVGYIAYDCIQYFEPKVARELVDPVGVPEAVLMLHDDIVIFDHFKQTISIVCNANITHSRNCAELKETYAATLERIDTIYKKLESEDIPLPKQSEVLLGNSWTSNIGQAGYEGYVTKLKKYILEGQIFQAVPSQRVERPTTVNPFNVYLTLRTVNPSPYMFYIDCRDFQLVGATHVGLVKADAGGRIMTQLSAGTTRRGKDREEDEILGRALQASIKDRAEHVMLVDLNRNDISRVCDPTTTKVEKFMTVEKFSHVAHLVSHVNGTLRDNKTIFDAFRSCFPAGMVTGAPKIRAIELIAELEGEKRGVYAGAVGIWGLNGTMDTCPALRTMVFKDGIAYLQAGTASQST
jgi:anthranilate synthase component I